MPKEAVRLSNYLEKLDLPSIEEADSATQSGRSPTGKLRNFKAMSDEKFETVYDQVIAEDNDPEAMDALETERARRDWI